MVGLSLSGVAAYTGLFPYGGDVFERLAHAVYRRRWTVIAIWAVLLLISIPFVPRVSSVLKGGGFDNGTSESDRATNALVDDLGFYRTSLTIIFSSDRWIA